MEKAPSKSVREKLNQWDTKLAVLDEFQREGIVEISAVASQRPFPIGVGWYDTLKPPYNGQLWTRHFGLYKEVKNVLSRYEVLHSEPLNLSFM